MAVKCLGSVGVCIARGLRLSAAGHIIGGANNGFITDNIQTVTIGVETNTGTEIIELNGCGGLGVNYKLPDSIKRLTVATTYLKFNPPVEEMSGGGTQLTATTGAVGFAYPQLGVADTSEFSLEFWSKFVNETTGSTDPEFPYLRWVLPRVNLNPTGFELGNSARKPQYTGVAYENTNWYNGPNEDVWPVTGGVQRALQVVPVATIPTSVCGYTVSTGS